MTAQPSLLKETIAGGLNFILSRQAEDGSWTDWALPPGSSSAWTTAYLGYKLRRLPPDLARLAAPRITAAARWLSDHTFADRGWGYNEAVGSDADSTAFAILCLDSAGRPAPDAAYSMLGKLQCADGGFSTYPHMGEPDSWNVSHPDVTPIALLALLTHPAPDRNAIGRGVAYVLQQKTSLELWNSFWWRSCLYGTEACLSLLDAVGIEMPASAALARIEPTNAFEAALLASSLVYISRDGSQRISHLADRLISQQLPDGSWKSSPILRIPNRNCYEPWAASEAGELYADPNRLFTTTTVVAALTMIEGCQQFAIS
jgi:squalene cyclase